MAYPNDEKETTCIYDYVTKKWTVYTCVPRHLTKLQKTCGEPFWKEEEPDNKGVPRIIAAKWHVDGNQVRFYGPWKGKDEEEEEGVDEDVVQPAEESGRSGN